MNKSKNTNINIDFIALKVVLLLSKHLKMKISKFKLPTNLCCPYIK